MQFPNGVNKSNLIKLGVLGAAMYLLKNRNNSNSTAKIDNQNTQERQQEQDQQNQKNDNQRLTAFGLGRQLANKILGTKA